MTSPRPQVVPARRPVGWAAGVLEIATVVVWHAAIVTVVVTVVETLPERVFSGAWGRAGAELSLFVGGSPLLLASFIVSLVIASRTAGKPGRSPWMFGLRASAIGTSAVVVLVALLWLLWKFGRFVVADPVVLPLG